MPIFKDTKFEFATKCIFHNGCEFLSVCSFSSCHNYALFVVLFFVWFLYAWTIASLHKSAVFGHPVVWLSMFKTLKETWSKDSNWPENNVQIFSICRIRICSGNYFISIMQYKYFFALNWNFSGCCRISLVFTNEEQEKADL